MIETFPATFKTEPACQTLLSAQMQGVEWQGSRWTHPVRGFAPVGGYQDDLAILEVSGDDVGFRDDELLRRLALESDRAVFGLFAVPNQPLWDLREDDLIAYSFVQFLETGDPSWPALVPMATSVVAALDFVQEQTGIGRFVVTGASKRGWTCWLAAATGDPRIVGIAPRVFDNLDLAAQAQKQAADWGGYSPMVDDYSRRSLQSLAETSEGRALLDLVDPVRMLDRIHVPQLLIHGSNDPYWTVDALSLYWDRLDQARALIMPNQGHTLRLDSGWLGTLAAFCDACATGTLLPAPNDASVVFREELTAFSESRDFKHARWNANISLPDNRDVHETEIFRASMIQYTAEFEGRICELSTPVSVGR